MRSHYKAYKKVGQINTSVIERLDFPIDGSVYASPGVINHIKRHHGRQLTRKVKENLLQVIGSVIENPDYVGIDKKRGKIGALELIKKVDAMILVGLEIDLEDNYIYVSTLYPITNSKINNKIYSGRIIPFAAI